MSYSSTCLRCRQPLAVESANGLCQSCSKALETSGANGTSRAPHIEPAARMAASAGSTRGEPDWNGHTQTAAIARDAEAGTALANGVLPNSPSGYDLYRYLGGGGMGEVYLAREHTAERIVAMKFLRGAPHSTAADRFVTEVRTLAKLDHPNIVRVISVDGMNDRANPFFTMEYAAGGTLTDRVKASGPFAPMEAARIVAQVARAVEVAHGANILHRDLKPSNILLGTDGTPKVADFGLAKRTDLDEGLSMGTGPLGTPAFMPPEQISSRHGSLGPASDVYGLGATLFHLLTGRPPFQGDSQQDIIAKVEKDQPERVQSLRPDVPRELEGIVVKCLEKSSSQRYASASALADDLDRFVAGKLPKAPQQTRMRRARRWLGRNRVRVGSVGLALLATVAVALAPWKPSDPKTDAEFIAEMRGELAAGRPVVVVDEHGRARHRRWAFGVGEFVAPDEGRVACWARYDALLELFPSPEIDRYRISVDVRQVDSVDRLQDRPVVLSLVGIYLGHDLRLNAEGTKVHAFTAIKFRDFLQNPAKRAAGIEWEDDLLIQPQLQSSSEVARRVARIGTDPPPGVPGPWRPIAFEVTPESMTVVLDPKSPPVRHNLAQMSARIAELQQELSAHPAMQGANAIQLAPWSPRSPLGLYLYGSSIDVRNFIITPLPTPNS